MKQSRFRPRLALGAPIGIAAAAAAAGGLYVTHRTVDPLHTGPGLSAVHLGTGQPGPVTLEPGSYDVASVLTDCGDISVTLGPSEGGPAGTRVGWDDMGGPQGWTADPETGLGPHHVTRHQVEMTVSSRGPYWISTLDGLTYNNKDCEIDLTIKPR